MEAQLFYIFLPLVQEHHLWRNLHIKFLISLQCLISIVNFDREVPECHLVVGGGDGEYGLLPRLELNRGDGVGVPVNLSNWIDFGLFGTHEALKHAQIPDANLTFVVT